MNRIATWLASFALVIATFGSLCPACLAGMPTFALPTNDTITIPCHPDTTTIFQIRTNTIIASNCAMPSAPLVTADNAQATSHDRFLLSPILTIHVPRSTIHDPSDPHAAIRPIRNKINEKKPPPLVGTTVKKE